jgi:hypothetical protein
VQSAGATTLPARQHDGAACPVKAGPSGASCPFDGALAERGAERIFSVSIALSATRCLLTYVVFPVVTALVGATASLGPVVGLPLGVVAIAFDVAGIRRFFVARHRLRWPVAALYCAVIVLVAVLVARDVTELLR